MKTLDKFFAPILGALFLVTSFFAGCFPNANAQITPPYYNPANVNITGGAINGTTVGETTPANATASRLRIGASNDLYLTRYAAKQVMISSDGIGAGVNAGLIAGYLGLSGFGGIWSTGVTPSTSNYSLASSGTTTYINSTSVTGIAVNASPVLQSDATTITHLINVSYTKTITAAGTTGAQTINKTTGRVNFAAAATSLVVTNSLATANSICHVTKATNDATMRLGACVAAAGSITIYADVAPAAETAVNFTVTN